MDRRIELTAYPSPVEQALTKLNNRLYYSATYQATDDLVDPDQLFLESRQLYVKNQSSPGFPIPAPLYLAVDVALEPGCNGPDCNCPCPPDQVIGVTQTVWSDPADDIRRRLGTVTRPAGGEAQVQWSQWHQISGGSGCDCPDNLVTRDQVRTRLTGPITFYISKDGNDTTGDGLTEATALATWQGFQNRYVTGPDAFDANFQTITINFGPGEWTGGHVINQGRLIGSHHLIINGVSMDETIFSNANGSAIHVQGEGGNAGYVTIKNCSFRDYVNGISIANHGMARVANLTFHAAVQTNSSTRAICAYDFGSLLPGTIDHPANIHLNNVDCTWVFASWQFGMMNLHKFNVSIGNNCSWSGFGRAYYLGQINISRDSFNYTGNGTGRKYAIDQMGFIYAGNDGDWLPGSTPGYVNTAKGGVIA